MLESLNIPLNEQVVYVEKSKLNIADMWLIPLDRVRNLKWRGRWVQYCGDFNSPELPILN